MRILVTGAKGLIGSNYVTKSGYIENIIPISRSDCDLESYRSVCKIFEKYKPTHVLHLAALVGGIGANSSQKLRFYEVNQCINFNVVRASIFYGVEHFIAAGTGCAYPKKLEGQILSEKDFLEGPPEPTNDAYAYAKRSMLTHLQAAAESTKMKYTYFLPSNIYGPHDNFHPEHSHVIPGLIRRMDLNTGDRFRIWGTGKALRDFLYIDDLVSALDTIVSRKLTGVVNIASGSQHSILHVATLIKEILGVKAQFEFDTNKPDGQLTRIMDVSKLKQFWTPMVDLDDGLSLTISWYKTSKKVRV